MRNIRWQVLIALGGLLLVIGLLIGQSPAPDSTAPQPIVGGAYTEALIGAPARIDPILAGQNQVDEDISRLVFSGLIRFDARGNPLPDLAQEWAVSTDATLYTITLRDDAYWHDGTQVTSDDVMYTFSKFQDQDYPGPEDLAAFWSEVSMVRLDDRRVQFQLPEPFAPFLDYLSVGLLPDHLLRGVSASALIDHPFHLHPVGSGPFQFDRFLMEGGQVTGVSLTGFEPFYRERPFLERFDLRFFPDGESALAAWRAGEVQGIGRVDAPIFNTVLSDPSLNLYSARLPQIGIVFLNLKDPELTFLAEKDFRHALMLAVNRQWIIDSVFASQAAAAEGPILPGTWAHASDLPAIPFDRDQAEQLLTDLGWELPVGAVLGSEEYVRSKDDQPLTFHLVHADDPSHTAVAELLRQSWESIGVRVTLEAVQADTIIPDFLEPRDYEAVLTDIDLARSPDPDPYPFWHDSQAETGQNYSGFGDRNTGIWLERARTTADVGRRADLYRSFQFRFQDQLPALLLYYPVYNYAITSDMQGISVGPLFDPSDRFFNASEWYLLARRAALPEPTGEGTP